MCKNVRCITLSVCIYYRVSKSFMVSASLLFNSAWLCHKCCGLFIVQHACWVSKWLKTSRSFCFCTILHYCCSVGIQMKLAMEWISWVNLATNWPDCCPCWIYLAIYCGANACVECWICIVDGILVQFGE